MKKLLIQVTMVAMGQPAFANADNMLLAQAGSMEKPPRFETLDNLDKQGIGAGYQPRQFETTPLPPPKRVLGPIDTWRFESCQQDAAMAPTQSGINIKMRVCRDKFGQ